MNSQVAEEAKKGIWDILKWLLIIVWRFIKTHGKTKLIFKDQTLTYETDHVLCERIYQVHKPKRGRKVADCSELVNLIADREIIRAEIQLPQNLQPIPLPIKGVHLDPTHVLRDEFKSLKPDDLITISCQIPVETKDVLDIQESADVGGRRTRLKVANRLSYPLTGCNIPIGFWTNKPIKSIRLFRKGIEDQNFSIEVICTSRETCESKTFKERFPNGIHSDVAKSSDLLSGLVGINISLIADLDKKEIIEIELEHIQL